MDRDELYESLEIPEVPLRGHNTDPTPAKKLAELQKKLERSEVTFGVIGNT